MSPKELAAHEQQFQAAVKQAVAAKQPTPDLGGAAAKLQQAFDVATQAKTGITALLADLDKAYAEFKVVSSKVDVTLVDAEDPAAESRTGGQGPCDRVAHGHRAAR